MWSANIGYRFAAWRSGGFLAQKFNRRTALEPTTKLSYEALHPPLRQTAVEQNNGLLERKCPICKEGNLIIIGVFHKRGPPAIDLGDRRIFDTYSQE